MSPPRRRSARLASAQKGKATSELSSVAEMIETPSRRTTRNVQADTSMQSPMPEPSTPASSALKPPRSEMHPSRYHSSTGAPSSALRLGFSDIRKGGDELGGQDSTPTKVHHVPSSDFDFRIARQSASTELSSGAQRMLVEIREQAAKIKAELVAQREADGKGSISDRPIAKPKGKVGRYSAAHMAEFKKMDSIEGHASAWRAQDGRFTPAKSLKRTPSKAELDATPSTPRTDVAEISCDKSGSQDTPNRLSKPNLKRKSSAANLDGGSQVVSKRRNATTTPGKVSNTEVRQPLTSSVKRLNHRRGDNLTPGRDNQGAEMQSSNRSSFFSRLATPKKTTATASSAVSAKTIAKPTVTLVPSPNSNDVGSSKSISPSRLGSTASKASELRRRIISPKITKMKSILRGSHNSTEAQGVSTIPHLTTRGSQTPGPMRSSIKELPPIPLTTPRRKLTKRVTFTPDLVSAARSQSSPSPQRLSGFKLRPALRTIETHYPALEEVLTQPASSHSLYPDLSPLKRLISTSRNAISGSPSTPGTFTFRSDHTIKFGDASTSGFGASPGQSSVRHISVPVASGEMPGSFPAPPSPSSHPNKENKAPSPVKLLSGTAHGMQNKKRHRATSDEEDFEQNRAAKKQKSEKVPEGQALLAPNLMQATPARTSKLDRLRRTPSKALAGRTPGRTLVRDSASSASPSKRVPGLSMSRLNMLAQPKNRT